MKAMTFSLTTQQPLLATSFQGDPNSDVSYPYIPGSMIRGAIIGRYMRLHQLSELDLTNDEAKRLFFSASSTRYLNAYLLSQDKQPKRTLPTPLSWFKHKDAELPEPNSSGFVQIYDRAQEYELPEEVEPKKVEKKFCTVNGATVVLYSERRRINIHNQRDRKKGRSTPTKRDRQTGQIIARGEGEIFRYDAIDAEQTFQAVILCNDNDANLLKDLLEKSEDLWLGGSQSAGYGHTKIKDVTVHDTWNEIGLPAKKRVNHASFTITLLSDLILRDEWGQFTAISPTASMQEDSEQEDFKQQTSVPVTKSLEMLLGVNVKLEPKASFANTNLIGGFNRKWGLHLPQVPVLVAGSVFVFEQIPVTPEQIQQLEEQGIGEKRTEGFGRVAVNWLEEEIFQARQPGSSRVTDRPTLKLEASRSLAAQMAERLLKQKLERELQNQVGRLSLHGNITNNQLSRLQLVALQALSTTDLNLVLSLLNNLPSNASGQFELTKIGIETKSFKEQLYEWLRNPGSWINSRDLAVRIADVERGLTDELAREYTLRLIIAVAKKAIKEKN